MSVAASIPPITVVPMTCRATASDPDAVQNGTLPRRAPQPHLSRGIGRKARRQGMDLSFHSLRHSAVTWLKTASIPHATIMGVIGHESPPHVRPLHTHRSRRAGPRRAGAS
jgi:integrase